MNVQAFSERIRLLIGRGQLEIAAEELVEFLNQKWVSPEDRLRFQLYNLAIHQQSQLNDLKNDSLRGIVEHQDADIKRNKVRNALLNIIEELKEYQPDTKGGHKPYPPTNGTKNPSSVNSIVLLIIGLLLGVIVMFWYFSNQKAAATVPIYVEPVQVHEVPKTVEPKPQPQPTVTPPDNTTVTSTPPATNVPSDNTTSTSPQTPNTNKENWRMKEKAIYIQPSNAAKARYVPKPINTVDQ